MHVPTNLLAMPVVSMSVYTGTNEDWIDSIKFVVADPDNPDANTDDLPQLDLTGIRFLMEIRRVAPDHEVILEASTEAGTLKLGSPPDFGFLIINVPHADMLTKQPGRYVGDIVGYDEINARRCILIDLEIALGITRP